MDNRIKNISKIAGLSVFFLLIIIYAFSRSRDLIYGVEITKINIDGLPAQEGAKVENSVHEITGNAKNAINLTLNGREISINEQGDFNETIALLSGYNVVEIKAKDKFGNIDEKSFRLIGGSAKEAELQATY